MSADSPNSSATRRQFLATTAKAGGAFAASLSLSELSIARAAHAGGSDVVKFGLVGCGGRGTGAAAQLFDTSGRVQLVAMADAFQYRIDECTSQLRNQAAKLGEKSGRKVEDYFAATPDKCFTGLDAYEKVMQSDCDLVVLATPPGFRPAQFAAAIDAGKHVFMEKPVAVDAPGVRKVLEYGEIAKKKDLAVAVGLQRHHDPGYVETIKRLQDGAIGDILYTRVYWNGGGLWVRPRKPEQSELEYQVDNWYYFNWICGDHIVEQHIHNHDVSNWLLGAHPSEVNGMGGRQVRVGKEYGQIFDHHFCEYTYPSGQRMYSQCRHIDGAWSSVDEYAQGTRGSANLGGYTIYGPDGKVAWKYRGDRVDAWHQEQRDLIAALAKGERPNETKHGAESTMTSILGRMATYSGKIIRWDEAINSDLKLGPDTLTWKTEPPVKPDADGRYPIPKVGQEVVI